MMRVDVELNSIRVRNTRESDLDFVIHSERDPYNSQFVNQWTKEEHKNSLFQEDISHVIVEDTAADRPVGYGIIAGLTSLGRSIELKRIVTESRIRLMDIAVNNLKAFLEGAPVNIVNK